MPMSMYRHHVRENKQKVIAIVGAAIIGVGITFEMVTTGTNPNNNTKIEHANVKSYQLGCRGSIGSHSLTKVCLDMWSVEVVEYNATYNNADYSAYISRCNRNCIQYDAYY